MSLAGAFSPFPSAVVGEGHDDVCFVLVYFSPARILKWMCLSKSLEWAADHRPHLQYLVLFLHKGSTTPHASPAHARGTLTGRHPYSSAIHPPSVSTITIQGCALWLRDEATVHHSCCSCLFPFVPSWALVRAPSTRPRHKRFRSIDPLSKSWQHEAGNRKSLTPALPPAVLPFTTVRRHQQQTEAVRRRGPTPPAKAGRPATAASPGVAAPGGSREASPSPARNHGEWRR